MARVAGGKFQHEPFPQQKQVVSATNPCHEYVRKLDLKCEGNAWLRTVMARRCACESQSL